MKLILASILALSTSALYAQKMPSYLSYLKKVRVAQYEYQIFGYDPANTKLINKPCENEKTHWACADGEYGAIIVATTNNDNYAIVFNPGPSEDPEFSIYDKSKNLLESIGANEFYITSGNIIYTAGISNQMYNKRRKFTFKNGKFIEEKQPFYYVGMKTKTTKNISLYKNKTGNEIIANLTPNYEIEVILADADPNSNDQYYLVKTEFGLVGWLRLAEPYTYDTGIEDLRFNGD